MAIQKHYHLYWWKIFSKMDTISSKKTQPIPQGEKRLEIPVTRFKGCVGKDSTIPISTTTLEKILAFVQDEKEKDFIAFSNRQRKLRKEDPERYSENKRKHSPGIIMGEFTARNSSACQKYVPLLGFDIDGAKDEQQVEQLLAICEKDNFIFLAFPSPSGLGARIFIWCDSSLETHKIYYEACLDYLANLLAIPQKKDLIEQLLEEGFTSEKVKSHLKTTPHLDDSTSDVGRLWFISHVPKKKLVLNLNSQIITLKKEALQKEEKTAETSSSTPAIRNGSYKHEFTQSEKVENLISQIEHLAVDITQGVENWFKIGCSIASEFGESGREFFQRLSQFHPDFDRRATDEEYSRCLRKHKSGNISIGSFYKITKDNGFTLDFQALKQNHPDKFRVMPIKGHHSGNGQSPSFKTPASQSDGAFPIIPTTEFEVPEEISLPEYASKNLGIEDGCYTWEVKSQKGEQSVSPISNFLICPLYLLKHHSDPKRIWLIIDQSGEQDLICIPVKDMATPAKLRPFFEGKGVYVPSWNTKQLDALKIVLFQDEKRAEEIIILGYQPETGLYAFCNGVFDGKAFYQVNEFGIVECPAGIFYIPALSSINEDDNNAYLNERKFRYVNTSTSFKEWAALMVKVYGDNGKVAMAYLMAALFRDFIFSLLECFPLLFFFGPPKTGKSTCRESLMSVFGTPQTAVSLGGDSTSKSFARKSAQFRNSLVCFEEYKNDIKKSKHETLKANYDGMGYDMAQLTNDNKTHSIPVYSSPIVVGQELPTKENALFSRVIICDFTITSHKTRDVFEELKKIEDEGLGKRPA
jgi:hypothetical protein